MNKLLVIAVVILGVWTLTLYRNVNDLTHRMDEMNCIHMIYEDGSAIHTDAEVAQECLRNH